MSPGQLSLFDVAGTGPHGARSLESFRRELRAFRWRNRRTDVRATTVEAGERAPLSVETFVNEFWTSRQRAAHSLHEISYRACFKPQLPGFFIERLTRPGDRVYDPFMGRGTTVLEAALMGRAPLGCDVNPLSAILVAPRLEPPAVEEVRRRLEEISFSQAAERPEDLRAFYHPETLRELCALRAHLLAREAAGALDRVDRWIRMVAVNRLTGHSPGFFSVYTLPPNQAVSVEAQRKINARRGQSPPRRSVPALILRKTRALLADCDAASRAALAAAARGCRLITADAGSTPGIETGSVELVVTSPPFLDVVDYAADNWLRCWFCGIDPKAVRLTVVKSLEEWKAEMTRVFIEFARVLRPGGFVAFEVGEVRRGRVLLEEAVIPCGARAGLQAELVLVNRQRFTKTANCWGVRNGELGTNTNRIVLFLKPGARRR